jgi:AraC family transcriptional regulator of adaptative response/methylated-DNA-[protein]-cysteine methyltransferase
MAEGINPKFDSDESRWRAVIDHDPTADGDFVYAVKTTGIYCRPGCASRLPKRENVLFFDNQKAAEAGGYRACKRCRPDRASNTEHHDAILKACRRINEAEICISLSDLAAEAGLSPTYFQKLFKKYVGVSPKQYELEKRSKRVQATIKTSDRVTDAIYQAGYGSSGQFYNQAAQTLGMTPKVFKAGAEGMQVVFTIRACRFGKLLVAATSIGICAVELGDDEAALTERLRDRFPQAALTDKNPIFNDLVETAITAINDPKHRINLPLDIQGSAFQRQVWSALREIPPGKTASYREIASKIGKPKAVRAVANACAGNKIALLIPCHRVVRSDGSLGGYRWGVDRKKAILEFESKLN